MSKAHIGSIEWKAATNLAHDQEDQQGQTSPHQLLVERDLGLRLLNLGQECHEGLDKVKKSH